MNDFLPLTHGSRVITTRAITTTGDDGESVTIPGGMLATVDYIDGPHDGRWIVGVVADDAWRVPATLREFNSHNDIHPSYFEHSHSHGDHVPFHILSSPTPITGD